MITPPRRGPAAAPIPPSAPSADRALVRVAPVRVSVSRESIAGSISATPIPSSSDQPTSMNTRLGPRAVISEPSTKTRAPKTKVRRYPWRAPSLLAVIRKAATTRAYSEIADCTPVSVVCRSRTMADSATFMAVEVYVITTFCRARGRNSAPTSGPCPSPCGPSKRRALFRRPTTRPVTRCSPRGSWPWTQPAHVPVSLVVQDARVAHGGFAGMRRMAHSTSAYRGRRTVIGGPRDGGGRPPQDGDCQPTTAGIAFIKKRPVPAPFTSPKRDRPVCPGNVIYPGRYPPQPGHRRPKAHPALV